jgi:hypothetical protein
MWTQKYLANILTKKGVCDASTLLEDILPNLDEILGKVEPVEG